MHISTGQIQKVFELHLHKVHVGDLRADFSARRPDQLILSRQASEMQEIKRFVSGLPDIRQDRVRDLRASIQDGAYDVPDHDLASAMLSSAKQGRIPN